MSIQKLEEYKYKIDSLNNADVLANLCKLFNLDATSNGNTLILSNIKSVQTFVEWQNKLEHPKIEYIYAENIYKNFATISLYLEKNGLQFSHLSADNIIIINNQFFIPINTDDLYTIDNGNIVISHPYEKDNKYLSLELKDNDSLPLEISFKTFYSSIALLIYDLLIGLENTDYQKGLLIIYMTRLYWILYYSLLSTVDNRLIIN